MSIKINDLNLEQVEKIAIDYGMLPAFTGQNPYIASGPDHEILVSVQITGLYQVELLDKKEMEESLQQTIKVFKEYAAAAKS